MSGERETKTIGGRLRRHLRQTVECVYMNEISGWKKKSKKIGKAFNKISVKLMKPIYTIKCLKATVWLDGRTNGRMDLNLESVERYKV